MSKGGKTGGGPQRINGGGPLTSSRPPSGMGDEYGFGYNPNRPSPGTPSGPGKGGRGMPPQQFGGGWGQPQFQGGFGGYGQGLQRPSGPGKGGPFQGPGSSYNQPQMPFGYGQMQYSPQRFHGYGVPSSMAQPFPDVRSPSPGYPQPPPDFQLPPPGYPQQYGRQPGMGGPGKGGRRRGPPPYMGGRGLGGPGYDPRAGAGPSPQERHQAALTRARRLSMQGGGGGISYGAGKHRRMAESARDGGFSPQQMREQQLYAAGQQQQEEYGPVGGAYAQMTQNLGRDDPLRLQLPEQYNAQKEQLMRQQQQYAALAPAYRDVGEMAYSGGGGIAGIYGPGGRVR